MRKSLRGCVTRGKMAAVSFFFLLDAFLPYAWGDGPPERDLRMTVKEQEGIYLLEGTIFIQAGIETVWGVLTDYEKIPRFVFSVRSSRFVETRDGQRLLEQEAGGRALFFGVRVHVLLEITEPPSLAIVFADVSRRDFDLYKGSWQIHRDAKGLGSITS